MYSAMALSYECDTNAVRSVRAVLDPFIAFCVVLASAHVNGNAGSKQSIL